jgi:plastocyanin
MSRRFLVWAVATAAASLLVMPAGAAGKRGADVRHVQALDACDPTTFNAAVGPGTCTRSGGGLPFDHFIRQLQKHGRAAAWRFSPEQLKLHAGGSLVVTNRGGEEHTFTEVANFGGGCVAPLNAILGLTPVPECAVPGLFASTLIAPGATRKVTTGLTPGVHLFECLIHPWMRSTVTVR